MLEQKVLQTLAKRTSLRPVHEPLVKHHANADIAALERDAPRPPAVPDEMIRGRVANAVTGHRPFRKFLREFESVPILHAAPA